MSIQNVTGFDWDRGNLEKCQKHGVEIAEIESAFHQTMVVLKKARVVVQDDDLTKATEDLKEAEKRFSDLKRYDRFSSSR